MEVLLWQDIDRVGKRGGVISVSRGYARNYLFPRKLASTPTDANRRRMEDEKKRIVRSQEQVLVKLSELAKKIEQSSYMIEVKANTEGGLFGSITPQVIIDTLAKDGAGGLKPEMIQLESPIKELGVYRVKINLGPDNIATCRLWVVEEHVSQKEPETEK